MEKVNKSSERYALRREFIGYVLTTFFLVAFLSLVVVLGCVAIREWLVPSSDKMRLNWLPSGTASSPEAPNMGYVTLVPAEPDVINPFYMDDGEENRVFTLGAGRYADTGMDFCLTRVYNSPQSLSPRKKLVYYGSGVIMIALPVILSLSGILLCGFLFYDEKLKAPIDILKRSAEKISEQDLDFRIEYGARDELGELCGAFEQIRDISGDKIILVSTHVVSDIQSIAGEIIILKSGKIVDRNTVDGLCEKYAERDLERVYMRIFGEE